MAERKPNFPSFIDEVERLFDELVHNPWKRIGPAQIRGLGRVLQPGGPDLEITVPVPGGRLKNLAVALEAGQLTIMLRRSEARAGASGRGGARRKSEEQFQQSVRLPEGAQVRSLEVLPEGEIVRLRVWLRS